MLIYFFYVIINLIKKKNMNNKKYIYKQENQEDIIFEFSDFAIFAEKEILASCGETKVLVTIAKGEKTDRDYLPLRVDYLEKFYAAGEILGGKYNKREGKPSTEATLTARLIDRSIRPYFSKDMKNELQIVVSVLSLGKYDPDTIALNAVSLALMTSSIKWDGPVYANRIILSKNKERIIINPSYKERDESFSESLVSFKNENGLKVCMIENDSSQIKENELLELLKKSQEEAVKFSEFINNIIKFERNNENEIIDNDEIEEENQLLKDLEDDWSSFYDEKIRNDLKLIIDKEEIKAIKNDLFELEVKKDFFEDIDKNFVNDFVDKKLKNIMRTEILNNKRRIDGRDLDQVRELKIQAGGFSKIHHGTGIFYRGQTHIMSVLTMGDLDDALYIEGMEINTNKNFIHHYNFPPFSVGEAGRIGSPKRREIGHGALAEKAIRRVIPSRDEFPYTMRVVSEAFSSNGSTSMGSTTASTLALLDGGVPIEPVAGIAMGLVYDNETDNYELLTDIAGIEDHFGDMDFKVTGTKNGITAIQLDIKNISLTLEMCKEIFERAKIAREYILDEIKEVISGPREISANVDRIVKIMIPKNKIGSIIGRGGSVINKITKDTGAKINIKRDGETFIVGGSENTKKAKEIIENILSM